MVEEDLQPLEDALKQAQQEMARQYKSRRFRKRLMAGGMVLGLLWLVSVFVTDRSPDTQLGFIAALPLFAFVVGFCLVVMGGGAVLATQAHQEAVLRLAASEDPRVVGPLLEALSFINQEMHRATLAALSRLLLRLRMEDSSFLNMRQRECLYRLLNSTEADEALKLVVLGAIAQVGDYRAIPYIGRLIGRLTCGEEPASEALMQAAKELGALLRARLRQGQSGETLLRASAAPPASPATLLRPAASSETSPDQLLRAGPDSRKE